MSIATHRGTVCLHCFQAFVGAPDLHIAGCGETPAEARGEALTRIETRYDAAIKEAKTRDELRMAGLVGLNTDNQRKRWRAALDALNALDTDGQVAA